jgi:hydrogenase/urease accessory protein HupE
MSRTLRLWLSLVVWSYAGLAGAHDAGPAHFDIIGIAAGTGTLAVAGAYWMHGVAHILLGYDHLLFVLALMLIVRDTRVLVWTITAFTVAHSVTLGLATLGVVHVPGPPVEAAIALSILLLACEIVRIRHGRQSMTLRWPWAVAFAFGLLHGFGFAAALAEVGFPKGDIPVALVAFNVGVELGQLIFIAGVLGAVALARRVSLPNVILRHAYPAVTFGMGAVAAFWLVERVAAFWA